MTKRRVEFSQRVARRSILNGYSLSTSHICSTNIDRILKEYVLIRRGIPSAVTSKATHRAGIHVTERDARDRSGRSLLALRILFDAR
jgi:hypothetical protein